MTTEKTIFQTIWIKVKQTPHGFQYLERRGKDSIAVFVTRKSDKGKEILIRYQPLPIHNADIDEEQKLYPCPITGGFYEGRLPEDTAIHEVWEEAGYKVEWVTPLGSYIVGTQTNETVFMFHADVTGLEPETPQGDGTYFESISKNVWEPLENLFSYEYSACQIGALKIFQKGLID